jgi:LAS superfamily LD-carboxypeptidase LdcB
LFQNKGKQKQTVIKNKPKIFFSDKVSGGSGGINRGGKGNSNQQNSDSEFDNRLTPEELDNYGENQRINALKDLERSDKELDAQQEIDTQKAFQDLGGNKKVGEEDDRLNENYKQQLASREPDAPMEPSAVGPSSPLRFAEAKNGQRQVLPGESDGTGKAVNPLQFNDRDEQAINQGVVDRINKGKGRLNLANKAREMFGENGDQKDKAISEYEGEKALQDAETAKDFARQLAIKKAKDMLLKRAVVMLAPMLPWLMIAALIVGLLVVASGAVICVLDRNPVTQVFLPENLKGFCGDQKGGGGVCGSGYTAWTRDANGNWVQGAGATASGDGGTTGGSYSGGSFCFDKGIEGKTSFNLWRANNGLKQETYSVEKVKEVIEAGKQAGVADYAIAWAIALAPTESGFDWTVWNGAKYDCWGLIQFCRSGLGGQTYQRISQKVAGRDVPPSEFIKDKPLQMKFIQAEFDDKKDQNCRYARDKGDFYLVSYAHLGCVRPGGGDGNTKSADYGEAAIRNAAFFECAKIGQAKNNSLIQSTFATVTRDLNSFGKIFTGVEAEAAEGGENEQAIRQRVADYYKKGEFYQTGTGSNDKTSATTNTQNAIRNGQFNINVVKYLDNLHRAGLAVATGPFDFGRSYGDHMNPSYALDIWGLGSLSDIQAGGPIKGLKTSGVGSGLAGGNPDTPANNGNTVDPRIRRHADVSVDSVASELFTKAANIAKASGATRYMLASELWSNRKIVNEANYAHRHHLHVGVYRDNRDYKYNDGGGGEVPSSGTSDATTGGSGITVCCPPGVTPIGAGLVSDAGSTTSDVKLPDPSSTAKDGVKPTKYTDITENHRKLLDWVATQKNYVKNPIASGPDSNLVKSTDQLIAKAKTEGIELEIGGEKKDYGWRSLDDQTSLFFAKISNVYEGQSPVPDGVPDSVKNDYLNRASLSAPPGAYSEHIAGKAVDFYSSKTYPGSQELNPKTYSLELYNWLKKNAPAAGFALSYGENSTHGAGFEPWHWKYVGTKTGFVENPEAKTTSLDNFAKIFTGVDVEAAESENNLLNSISDGFSIKAYAETPLNKPTGTDPATQFMIRVATMEGAFATGSGGPNTPQKNKNPGNLKGPSSLIENYLKQKFPGSYASGIPLDGKKHLIFDSEEHGWAALYYFFQRNFQGNVAPYDKAKTIGDFFNIYAPSSDGNNLSSYMKFIEEGNIALSSGGKITKDTPIPEMAKIFGSDYQGGASTSTGAAGGACCLPSGGGAVASTGGTSADPSQSGTSADVETLKAKIKSGEIKVWKRNSSRGFVSEDFYVQDIDKQKADPNVAKFILTMHSKYPNSVVNALGDLSHGQTGGSHNSTPLLAVDIGGINTGNVDNESKAVIDKYLADAQATGLVRKVGLSPVVRAKGVTTPNQFDDSVGHIHFTIKQSTTTGYLDQQKDSELEQNINNLANNSADFDFAKIFTGVDVEAAENEQNSFDVKQIWNGIINGVAVEAAGDKYQQILGSDYSLDKYYDENNKALAARSGSLDKRFPGNPNYFILHITTAANVYDGGNDTKVLGQQFYEGIAQAGPGKNSGFTPFGMTSSGKVSAFYDPVKYWGEGTDGKADRGNARIREITADGKAGKVLYSGSGSTSVDAVAVQVEMIANSGDSATEAQAISSGKLIAASGVMPDKVITHYAVQPSDRQTDNPFIAKNGTVDGRLVKLVNSARQSNSAWKGGAYASMTDEQVAAMITKINLLMAQANGDTSITDAIIAKLGADKVVVTGGNSTDSTSGVSGAGCTGGGGSSTDGGGGSSTDGGGGTSGIVGSGSAALLALAKANSEGKGPDGRCQYHVESYLDRVKLGGLSTVGLNFPNPVGFQPYLVANKDKLGIKNLLDENPSLNPYNAPPGSVVIVTPGGIGTCAAVHGDIAVADGAGKFYNGGVNSFGGEKCWNGPTSTCKNSPRCGSYGQTGKLLGIWVPK